MVIKIKLSQINRYSKRWIKRIYVFMMSILCSVSWLQSQNIDTSVYGLKEITIVESRYKALMPTKKNIHIDSVILSQYNTSSLSDLLASQSNIHIKSYGHGNIATTSMRGGNANHTTILWNGLNIQNALLGQTDLSVIPSVFFNDISLEYGGGSAAWGSGAIGGSIHLTNTPKFHQGLKTNLQISVASFGTKKIASNVILGNEKITSHTSLFFTTSENNYTYKDTSDHVKQVKQMSHAKYQAKGFLQELSYKINPYQLANVRLWYNEFNRYLPSFSLLSGKQYQLDKNLKLNVDWNYNKRKLNTGIRLGYFDDQLNYTDSLQSIFSKSPIKSLITEADIQYNHNKQLFSFSVNGTSYQTGDYRKKDLTQEQKDTTFTHQLNKVAFFAGYRLGLFQSRITFNIAIRKEFTNQTVIPLTGNTGIHYRWNKHLTSKVNANKSYRQPTLNDLYWYPGGNPHLKPEDGYEVEGGMEGLYQFKNMKLIFELNYFNRHTVNWIMWLPGENAYWSPKNITEVYSRGTDTKMEISYLNKEWELKSILYTSYVLSTNQKSMGQNDQSLGRQLIFTPRYNGQHTFFIRYKTSLILVNQTYTGYRFTTTDNSAWLTPFYLVNIKYAYQVTFKNFGFDFFCHINNLLNKNYVVMPNRPMPLRNYELGINIKCHKSIKKQLSSN